MESQMNASANITSANAPPSINQRNAALKGSAEIAGRVLLATLFLLAGISKLGAYNATAAYMSSAGVPAVLLPAVIATELGGALAIILGWRTRVVAALLAGFSILTALVFHNNFADQAQMVNFLKNLSIAGGLLLLVVNGAGPFSIDRRSGR
jgi:putative oxidoreductase